MRLPATDYEFMNTVRCTELNVCNSCYLFERQRALVMIILNEKVNFLPICEPRILNFELG